MIYPGFDISGKVALITGGTSGLGRAIALGMARCGARVFAGSRDLNKIAETREQFAKIGPEHEIFQLDVAEPQSIATQFAAVKEKAGRIDILLNAAGITHREPALDVSAEDFEKVVRINLTGTFLCAQAAARVMKDQPEGGSIINIASISSFVGLSLVSAYGASKAAVWQLTKNLANEWAQYRIRVNALAPGVFPTVLNRPLIDGTPRGKWFLAHKPMKRFGEYEELVGAAIYLASPAASYVTGETIVVDGGFMAIGVPMELPKEFET